MKARPGRRSAGRAAAGGAEEVVPPAEAPVEAPAEEAPGRTAKRKRSRASSGEPEPPKEGARKCRKAAAGPSEAVLAGPTASGGPAQAEGLDQVDQVDQAPQAAEASEAGPTAQAAKSRRRKKRATAGAAVEGAPAKAAEDQGANDGEAAEAVARTVFVDGVPYTWTSEKVQELFQQCGAVESVGAPTWQDSGRLRGYAHVCFVQAASVKKAVALSGTKVGKEGRFLKVEPARGPKERPGAVPVASTEGTCRLFVKNLPYDATEAEVGGLFKSCGKVREVRIPTDRGRCKGFAYVEFARPDGLRAAVQLRPAPSLRGRQLHLDADAGHGPRAGFHYRPEAYKSPFQPQAHRKSDERPKKLSLF